MSGGSRAAGRPGSVGGCDGGACGWPPVMRTNEFHDGFGLPFSFSRPEEEQKGQSS